MEFLENVWCIGAHIGIVIPDPNEQTEMQKLKELHELLYTIYFKSRDFIKGKNIYNIGPEIKITIGNNSASINCYLFTEYHIEISVFTHEEITKSLISVTPEFNDKYVYEIIQKINDLYNSEINPKINKENRLSVIDSQIENLTKEKQILENE
ncbi:hypothetical protein ORI89_17525 [Sphingobacterium sp. UT-1RO-CII-1]|nr:hypothetical protein [Sphingobacterium sp. UT-1RO-CII-1]